MTRRLLLVVAELVAASAVATAVDIPHPSVRVAEPSAWVDEVDLATEIREAPAVESAASASLQYLLVDRQTRLAGDSTARYSRTVIRVLTASGLEEAAQHSLDFDPGYSRAVIHALRVWRSGGWEDRLEDAFVSVIQRESDLSRRLYDGGLTVLLVMSDLQVGDVVDLAWTIEGANPVMGGRYVESLGMGWSQPIVRRHVRVVGNADSPLHWRMYGAETSAPEQRTANGRLEWRWHLRDLPVADDESGAPAWWDGYPWLQLSQFGSWSEVVAWGVPLYDRSRPGPRLRALAQEIRATDGDPVEQALIAVRRVQDEVRYFAFTLGEGSHAPRPAEETLRRRFGDCKDKTNLLVHLLRELGHEAWPALVSSDGDETARRLPSPGVFDHVIVLARVAGREVWIDPTIQLQGGDLWHLALPDYRSALVLRPGESDLVVPPAEARRPGAFEGETTYDLRSDGSCEVTVTSRHLGAAADDERANLSDTTPDELQDAYRDYYERGGGQVEPLAPIGFDDDRRTNVLTTVERYRLDDWWLDDGDGRRFPLLRLTIGDILDAAPERGRRAPFDIPRGVDHREVVHLSMPADWKVEADTREVSSPYFTFSSRLESGPPIRLEWRLETGDHEVPAADIGPYNDAVDAVDQLLDATVLDPSIVGLVMPRTAAVLSLATVGLGALGIVLGVGFVLRKARWL